MKNKFYSVVAILLFFASHVFSQTVGINSGILISNLYVTTKGQAQENLLKNYETKIGYSIGVTLNFNLQGEGMSIEYGLMYVNLGAKYNSLDGVVISPTGFYVVEDRTVKLNYIMLPVLFRYSLSKNFMLKIGPQFAYLFSNKVSSEVLGESELITESKFDFGVNTGLGYILNPKFDISLNFYNGFGKVEKIDCLSCSDNSEANSKNRYIILSVNYTLCKK